MKIVNLVVDNFRAINHVEMYGLQGMIVIAGPNGCGKSCILDAVRLFKSVYGGYQPNEWQQWLNEFQINIRNRQQMVSLLRDKTRPSVIRAEIELDDNEIKFIRQELTHLLEELVWKTEVPASERLFHSSQSLATSLRAYQPQVNQKVQELMEPALQGLNQRLLVGQLEIMPNGTATTIKNVLLELVFSSFQPTHIGVIDYHGAHRNYVREGLGGINLNFDQEEERLRTTALYNVANKYANIKSEMAADFVKQVLVEKSQVKESSNNQTRPLSEALQELFRIFFPGKKFLGPVPTMDGNLDFPVEIEGGSTHDINDLSSGEKEILFGYLRLRNSAPKYSVVLLDEPELHLNPALVRGLPQFYEKYMGQDLQNQIWLVTHSDAFLREAMGHSGIHVYHLQHAAVAGMGNQIHEIKHGEEIEAILLEMVGNLATYSPGAKVVIFEGENSEFDLKMVSRLFPTIENEVNLVSGGNRLTVETLHQTLERSVEAGNIPVKIYSVVDKDSGSVVNPTHKAGRHFSWDVYHIENYLLEPKFIDEVLGNIQQSHNELSSLGKIDSTLKEIAQEQISQLVVHKVGMPIRSELLRQLSWKPNPMSDNLGEDLHKSITKSIERMTNNIESSLSVGDITSRVEEERKTLEESLTTEDWKKYFKGREILRAFAGKYVRGMKYEYFRDLIITQMVNSGYQPEGMKSIINKILDD